MDKIPHFLFFHGYWKWFATLLGIVGGLMIGVNISYVSRYGFIPFLLSSIIWLFVGYKMKENSIIILNATFVLINVLGVYQWLIV